MALAPILAAFLLGAVASFPSQEPLACRIDALSAAQRDRHHDLGEKLRGAVTAIRELADGYELELDLGRLPRDSQGPPFGVAEVAEWVDLEARCCPFLDFDIHLAGRGGPVRLGLTGPANAKEVLRAELPLVRRSDR